MSVDINLPSSPAVRVIMMMMIIMMIMMIMRFDVPAIAPSLQARSVELDLNMRKAAVNRMLRRRPSLCEMDLRGWFDPNAPVLTPSPTHAYEVAYAMVAANRAQASRSRRLKGYCTAVVEHGREGGAFGLSCIFFSIDTTS